MKTIIYDREPLGNKTLMYMYTFFVDMSYDIRPIYRVVVSSPEIPFLKGNIIVIYFFVSSPSTLEGQRHGDTKWQK
jgi:hypothetical protein